MKSPAGSREPIGSAWRLKRCLYGLSQSPRLFNKKLHSVLITLDWCQSSHDPCLYFQRHGTELSLLAVVVDDLLLATPNLDLADRFRTSMSEVFDFKAMGIPRYMIGLHLRHEPLCLHISQRQYIEDVGLRFADLLGPVKPTSTPAAGNLRLVKSGLADQPASPPADRDLYRSLVGSLMYATEACKEVMWLRHLLAEIGLVQPTTLFHEDNAACIKMATNAIVSGRNKHMELKMHFVREKVEALDISLQYVSTRAQRADLLSKILPRPAFEKFRAQLMQPSSLIPEDHSVGGVNSRLSLLFRCCFLCH